MPKKFNLRPEAFQHDVRATSLLVVLVIAGFIVAPFVLSLMTGQVKLYDLLNLTTWAVLLSSFRDTILIFIGVGLFLTFLIRANMKFRKASWDSLEIEIADDYIARRQLNNPEIRLGRDEISSLEDKGNVLCVYSTDKRRVLGIPKLLNGYDEVKQTVLSWGKPLTSSQTRTRIMTWVNSGIILVGFLAIIFAFDPVTQAIATLATVGWMGNLYRQMGRQEGDTAKLRSNFLRLIGVIALLGTCKLMSLMFIFFAPSR